MKITIVLGAFFPVPPIMGGAVEKVWFALGQEFARRGHEVTQISRRHPQLSSRETIAGVNHVRVSGFAQPRSLFWLKCLDLLYSLRVRRVLPRGDILVTNTFFLPLLVRSESHGRLCVHVARGPKGQMRWYAHAARLQAVSRAIADAIIAQAPRLRSKVRVLPNPLPFQLPPLSDSSRDKTILFVGRIHPEKGLELLLRSLRAVSKEVLSSAKLKIIGPHETHLGGGGDNFLETLRELAGKSGASVQWIGPIFDEGELSAHYRRALIFVYPSMAETGEAMPLAPLEAMANGCVPLVSNLDCFRDYIENGVTGFLFDHRGENAEQNLAAQLTKLFQMSSDKITKISAAAHAKAAEFALEPVAKSYLDDFATLLAQAAGLSETIRNADARTITER
jgi:glycosyltransferase involved in cell wall biosynthesis